MADKRYRSRLRALGDTRGFSLERQPVYRKPSPDTRDDLREFGLDMKVHPHSVSVIGMPDTSLAIGLHRYHGGHVTAQKMVRRIMERTAPMSSEPVKDLEVLGVELHQHREGPSRNILLMLGMPEPLVEQRRLSLEAFHGIIKYEPVKPADDDHWFAVEIGRTDDPTLQLNDDILELINPGTIWLEKTEVFPHLEDLGRLND